MRGREKPGLGRDGEWNDAADKAQWEDERENERELVGLMKTPLDAPEAWFFSVRRLDQHAGPDRPGDSFGVCALAPEARQGDVHVKSVVLRVFSGSLGARGEAERLCRLLNQAVRNFHQGRAEGDVR